MPYPAPPFRRKHLKLRLIPILHGVLALCLAATVSWAQDNKPGPQKAAPASEAPQEPCYAAYGLRPAEKIKICSDTIQSGRLKGIPLALAYYHRATADSAIGDVQAATSDYKEALRIFTEVIRVSQASAPLLFQRGLIYHTLGDADQAIVDYSDSIRIAPNETYAYVNRGIVLYTKKDNNEGAIADFNSDRKSTRLNSSHIPLSRMPSSA